MSNLLQLFEKYKNKKIALYGLGIETEKVLPEFGDEFQIIGLLDGYQEEGELYGKSIIPFSEVIRQEVKLIIVIARPGSCKAIAKRIGKWCYENQIILMDIRGKNLLNEQKVIYNFVNVEGISKQELLQYIEKYDVISVDMFDTLIMRNTLFSTDVYEILDGRLKQQGIAIEDFAKKRLNSEKYLATKGAQRLIEIYQYMIEKYSIVGITAKILADEEWKTDCDILLPRQEMCDILTQTYAKGKEVYIVSDTYYTKKQLQYLCKKFDITVTDIIASCEYRTSKTQQLYTKLRERISGKLCLHIGDDSIADVEIATKFGLGTYKIYSGIELLEYTGYMGMWNQVETLADRIKLGMFIAKLFNSPFQFESKEKKIFVTKAQEIGYLFVAPMITDFVIWFENMVKKNNITNVWMSTRDGYLLKKLYDYLKKEESSVYFFTSRTAAIRAGMENKADIDYVMQMKFSGSLKEQLAVRFGIEAETMDGETLENYKEEIIERSSLLRNNYRCYINKINIKAGDIAFFDFVAKGTVQKYLRELINNHIKGLYFLQLEEENMRQFNLDIESFYTMEERYNTTIFEDYYILETILTSPEPSLSEFDFYGDPVFANETRCEEELECVLEEQNGIFEYFTTFLKLCPDEERIENKKLDELFLALIHKVNVTERKFLNLKVEDPFFNRNTEIITLL